MSNSTAALAEHLPEPKQTLYLLDISSFIFRAFYAIRALRSPAGEPTNAVYGVATMLARLAEEAKPEYLAVVYDSKGPSFRKEIYPEYKANRTAPPDDLIPQFARVEQLIQSFEIHSYRQTGLEADDLIATLTQRWIALSSQHHVVIVSGDKDLMQLVTPQVKIWDTMKNITYGPKEVEDKFGIRPDQIRDYLALVGDSSDNIPGVTGIGPKGAVELLKEHQTLTAVLDAAQAGKIAGKKGEALQNHRKDAEISAELATVRVDLEVDIPLESLKYHFHVTPSCVQLLEELNFKSLVTKWQAATPGAIRSVPSGRNETGPAEETPIKAPAQAAVLEIDLNDKRFRPIQTEKALHELLSEMRKTKKFGFDLETTSLNPREAEIVGVSICCDLEVAYYIPVGHRGTDEPQLPKDLVLDLLKPLIEDPRLHKIGQNLKYDFSVLRCLGWNPQGIYADTMIAGYLLDPDGRHNLTTLAAHYLGYTVLTYEQVCGKGKDQLGFDQIGIPLATRYSAEDAWVAVHLWEKLEKLLKSEGLYEIFEKVDLPLVDVLSKMELEGVCIDVPWLKKLSHEFGTSLHEIETRVQAFTQGPINLNSPKQLGHLLFEVLKLPTQGKTKTGFSTDAKVLEALAPLHEVPRLLLEYREISKLKSTYVDPLPQIRDAKSGRIHTSFNQTIAATGRLSSSEPNLQNIPIRSERGMKIRRAFIPSKDHVLLSADYNQIELRLLAHMSGDPELTHSFLKGEDVHRRTASEIYGISADQINDEQRAVAKAINFGLMYGKTAFGLSQELGIPRKEAAEMISRYFVRYKAVKDFLDRQIAFAKEKGYVASLLGRKRRLPDVNSKNAMIRNNAERMAMNTPIQGTAADLIKLAMTEIQKRLEKQNFQSKLIIQVHDEVVLDCQRDEVEAVQKMVCEVMEGVFSLSVPLRVSSATGDNWMDL